MPYQAPVRDLMFALSEVVDIGRLTRTEAFSDVDRDTWTAVLEAAGSLAEDVLAPLNAVGDKTGARFENGAVVTPPGFPQAYQAFADGGWMGLTADPAYGGQGLPKTLDLAVSEMINAANMAFALCPLLTQGAIEAIAAHASDALKALYLPPMIAGRWSGAMNLTELQSGSDLGTLRTRAEPDGQGGYRLYGEKIFITWGDHDCAENIIHLVLARLPDAPAGSAGISLFLAPKRLVAADGSLGAANGLRPGGIEHKLGIHASPTCVLLFDGAQAMLVGQPHKGLAQMFTMMNTERLGVGIQGVGMAERAYQHALAYARERRQGRSAWTGQAQAVIIDHPDVRRMLADMKAKIEAARALCLLTALSADLGRHAANEAEREAARQREALLTPIAKAWSTDIGVEVASLGVQVHGGMGFIEETGAAQFYRDARIAPIYEGTNGIQAIDLVGRKLGLGDGAALAALTADIRATVEALKATAAVAPIAERLDAGVDALETAAAWLAERRGQPDALAGATPFLTLAGEVTGGWLLAKGALAAAQGRAGDPAYAQARIALAAHFADSALALAPGRAAGVMAGAARLEALGATMGG